MERVSPSHTSPFFIVALAITSAAVNLAYADGRWCHVQGLSAEISMACSTGGVATPTVRCCAALIRASDLECICSVGSNKLVLRAGLDITIIYKLFNSCGGGVHVVPSCNGTVSGSRVAPPSAPTSTGTGTPLNVGAQSGEGKVPSTCKTPWIVDTILSECRGGISTGCCIPVMAAVGIRSCLCTVAIETGDDMVAEEIIRLYRSCGGIRRLPDSVAEVCKADANELAKSSEKLLVGLEVTQVAEILGVIGLVIYQFYKYYTG